MGVYYHPFFFAFCLSEIVVRSPTLLAVMISVWQPKRAITLTLILFIMIVYYFTIMAFLFFPYEQVRKDPDGYPIEVHYCEQFYICFLYTFDYTFKANGGVGGWQSDNKQLKWEDFPEMKEPDIAKGKKFVKRNYLIGYSVD